MKRFVNFIPCALVAAILLAQSPQPGNIVGPGATGATGGTGSTGATGATGATGPAPTGTGIVVNLTSGTPSAVKVAQRQSADLAKTNTTLADVTGISYSLAAGTAYTIQGFWFATESAAGGGKYQLAYTGTTASARYDVSCNEDTGNGSAFSVNTALNVTLDANWAFAGSGSCLVTGSFITTNAGTLTLQFAQSAASGTSTALTNSMLVITPVI